MFTGLIRHLGVVAAAESVRRGLRLTLRVPRSLGRLRRGDSLAVNGVCLTIERVSRLRPSFTAIPETLARTTLGTLQPGDRVHLERPLKASERLHGHIVQGHVDGVGVVKKVPSSRFQVPSLETGRRSPGTSFRGRKTRNPLGTWNLELGTRLAVRLPRRLCRFVVPKGSIALDGVSLTVARIRGGVAEVALIPETLRKTTLGRHGPGDGVNVEVDVLAKIALRRAGNG